MHGLTLLLNKEHDILATIIEDDHKNKYIYMLATLKQNTVYFIKLHTNIHIEKT